MKNVKLFKVAVSVLFLTFISSCASFTPGHNFCLSSGHMEESPGYYQCTSRYSSQRELYNYCTRVKGIVSEGPTLNSCLSNSRNLKSSFSRNESFCSNKASAKFSGKKHNVRLEEQMVITPEWRSGTVLVEVKDPTAQQTINREKDNYKSQCMISHGWNNPGAWQSEKRYVSQSKIDSGIRVLDNRKIDFASHSSTPTHMLYHKAAAEGDLKTVISFIDQKKVDTNVRNHQGYAALHFAALNGHSHVIRYLVEMYGADFEAKAQNNKSVMDIAVMGRSPDIVNYLLDKRREAEAKASTPTPNQPASNVVAPENSGQKDGNKDKIQKEIEKILGDIF